MTKNYIPYEEWKKTVPEGCANSLDDYDMALHEEKIPLKKADGKTWYDFDYDIEGDIVLEIRVPRWAALNAAEQLISQAKWERDEQAEIMLIGRLRKR
jgi:hypothetical protein